MHSTTVYISCILCSLSCVHENQNEKINSLQFHINQKESTMRMLYIKIMFIFINLQLFDVCSQKRKCQRNCNSLLKWKKNTIFELGLRVSFFLYFFIFYFETNCFTYIFSAFRNGMTVSFYLYLDFYLYFFCKYFHHTQNIFKKMR